MLSHPKYFLAKFKTFSVFTKVLSIPATPISLYIEADSPPGKYWKASLKKPNA
jgi:hypothetical protein